MDKNKCSIYALPGTFVNGSYFLVNDIILHKWAGFFYLNKEEQRELIIKFVSEKTNIPVSSIKSKCRKIEIVFARHIAITAMHNNRLGTLQNIANTFNNTHASIIHSIKTCVNTRELRFEYKKIFGYFPVLKIEATIENFTINN